MSWPDPMIIATICGPVMAVILSVLFSIWYQNRKQRLNAKEGLFQTLMSQRHSGMHSYEAVNALNLIDVVYEDNTQVLALWHRYYSALCQTPVNWTIANHDYLDLLSAMANSLGYKSLSQTDIDKCYVPQGHVDLAKMNIDIQTEWLRVLKNTARLAVDKKDEEETSS